MTKGVTEPLQGCFSTVCRIGWLKLWGTIAVMLVIPKPLAFVLLPVCVPGGAWRHGSNTSLLLQHSILIPCHILWRDFFHLIQGYINILQIHKSAPVLDSGSIYKQRTRADLFADIDFPFWFMCGSCFFGCSCQRDDRLRDDSLRLMFSLD